MNRVFQSDGRRVGMTRPPGQPPRRPTLQDVARHAEVSRTTASYVLAGRSDMGISTATEQRVRRAARELNYRPNLMSRGLRSRTSLTIGLVSDTVASEPFAGEMIRGGLSAALVLDHLLFVGETQGAAGVEKGLINGMLDRGVGGFVYASMYTRRVSVSRTLRAHPLVLLNCVNRDARISAVIPDERQAGRDIARLLLDHGHTRVAVAGEATTQILAATERLAGMEEVFAKEGVEVAHWIDTLWWPEPAHAATSAFLREGHRPTAVVCLNDRVAMGVYQAAAEHGLTIPNDLSVVSFDDSDLASWLRPGLTSVSLPHFELGRRAVELLVNPLDRPTTERIHMPVTLRESLADR